MYLSPVRVACLFSALLLSSCATPPKTSAPEQAAQTPVLLISIDGFRASYLGKGDTPNLDALANDGVRAQWMAPSYPALTFPNHYTLVTGLRPDHHGITHNMMYDKTLGEFRLSNTQATGDARWWNQGTPIWVTAEQHGLKTAIWAWPGSAAPIDGIRPSEYRLYDGDITPETRSAEVAQWLTLPANQRPAFTALYMENVDEEGHAYGPDSPQVHEALQRVDGAIGTLLNTLKQHNQLDTTNIIVVSDHGMAQSEPNQIIAVEDIVSPEEATVISTGQVVGFTPKLGFEEVVSQRLLGRHDHYTCWLKERLPVHWHYGTNTRRIPPIVCQMDEGWDAAPEKYAQIRRAQHSARGSHGYPPSLESMHAIFIAHGPVFRQGVVIPGFDNVNVYSLLASLLHVPAEPSDGSLTPLEPALNDAAKK